MGDYVEPYVESVDPIDPPEVEHVGPFTDSVDAGLPVEAPEQVAPVEAPAAGEEDGKEKPDKEPKSTQQSAGKKSGKK